ncbi:hypothetical protein WI604_16735 [Bradyrhizobium symbiodeficiens]
MRDLVAVPSERRFARSRPGIAFKQMCCGVAPSRHVDGAKSTQLKSSYRDSRILTELIPMPDVQVDHMAPSILPAEIPELSDDECLACLARAVETPDSARLDEVAALIGRLAVAIE